MSEITIFDNDFGKALIAAAKEKARSRVQESVVAEVENLMQLVTLTKERKAKHERNLRLFEGRLQAIEAGDFHIEQPLNAGSRIVYTDAQLNREFETEADPASNYFHAPAPTAC